MQPADAASILTRALAPFEHSRAAQKRDAMVDSDYFLAGLPMQVIEHGNAACVRLVTRDRDYLVRDVVRVFAGSVLLNVWLDAGGLAPIVADPSSLQAFEVLPPTEHKGVTIPFEEIAEVVVVAARQPFGRFSLA